MIQKEKSGYTKLLDLNSISSILQYFLILRIICIDKDIQRYLFYGI